MSRDDAYIAEGEGPDIRPGQTCHRIPPTVVVFYGNPTVFFVAICQDCGSAPTPQPFASRDARDTWVKGHREIGHTVTEAVEVRP